jgi:hypothetical protein
MRRKHLFEWEDQRWFPSSLRDLITDHLRSALSSPLTKSLRETVCDVLEGPLRRSKSTRIVDVCSGAGGPLPAVFAQLAERVGRPLTATLTDLYPNERAFERIENETSGGIRGHAGAVSAFDVPGELGRFRRCSRASIISNLPTQRAFLRTRQPSIERLSSSSRSDEGIWSSWL